MWRRLIYEIGTASDINYSLMYSCVLMTLCLREIERLGKWFHSLQKLHFFQIFFFRGSITDLISPFPCHTPVITTMLPPSKRCLKLTHLRGPIVTNCFVTYHLLDEWQLKEPFHITLFTCFHELAPISWCGLAQISESPPVRGSSINLPRGKLHNIAFFSSIWCR